MQLRCLRMVRQHRYQVCSKDKQVRDHKQMRERYSESPLSLSGFTLSPATRNFSSAHSPKSINLQRSEQKGLKGFSADQIRGLPQVGQLIFFCGVFVMVLSISCIAVGHPEI